MAIEELERRSGEIRDAEAVAIRSLVDQLRDLAVSLPDGSRLALTLATGASQVEEWAADANDPGLLGGSQLLRMNEDIEDQQARQWGDEEGKDD